MLKSSRKHSTNVIPKKGWWELPLILSSIHPWCSLLVCLTLLELLCLIQLSTDSFWQTELKSSKDRPILPMELLEAELFSANELSFLRPRLLPPRPLPQLQPQKPNLSRRPQHPQVVFLKDQMDRPSHQVSDQATHPPRRRLLPLVLSRHPPQCS